MVDVPIVNEINLRKNPKSNKFIQLEVDGNPYLRFIRPDNLEYHSEILFNTLLNEFGILPKFDGGRKTLSKGKRYQLVGIGKFRKDDEKIFLYGNSWEYPVAPDKDHAAEVSRLTGLELIVEDYS
ncbi:hypothetical protein HOD29_05485 [archaeon]|jgi:hypothetical protein|nr:hypothetical protein [archaeon]